MAETRNPLHNAVKAVADAMRLDATARMFHNASHLLGYADRLDDALCKSQPRGRQWRDADPDKVQPPGWTDPLEPIRRVFREAGLYSHAADDLLCLRLAEVMHEHHFPFEPTGAREVSGRALMARLSPSVGDVVDNAESQGVALVAVAEERFVCVYDLAERSDETAFTPPMERL